MAIPLHQERMRGEPSPERDGAYEDIYGRRDQYDTGPQDGVAGSEHEGFGDSGAGVADRAMLLQGRSPGKAMYGSTSPPRAIQATDPQQSPIGDDKDTDGGAYPHTVRKTVPTR